MVISSAILLYAFYALLGVFVLFSVFHLFHLFRFGLVGFGALFMGLLYIVVSILIVSQSLDRARAREWNESLNIPFTGSI